MGRESPVVGKWKRIEMSETVKQKNRRSGGTRKNSDLKSMLKPHNFFSKIMLIGFSGSTN
jgi:hypothetical protein